VVGVVENEVIREFAKEVISDISAAISTLEVNGQLDGIMAMTVKRASNDAYYSNGIACQ
jgi:hypothetical protein